MFKISYIKINYIDSSIESTLYHFKASNYIFGANNVGKTVMIQAIDFVLGKSNFSLDNKDGLEGIASVEAKIESEDRTLFLFRSNSRYGYKYSNIDIGYLTVDYELYKKEITSFLIGSSNEYFEDFKDYIEEDLSFRAFSFFNFVDEKGLGNLTNIFTRIDSFYNQKRANKIITFIFNHVNVSELVKLQKQQKQLEQDLERLQNSKATYNYLFNIIINGCRELQIPIKQGASIKEIESSFEIYKNIYKRDSQKEAKKTDDIFMLLKMSYNLSEELKYQENLQRQTNFLISRKKKAEQLLNALKALIFVDERYSKYVEEIENALKNQELSQEILSIKDFHQTIEDIRTKKESIDHQIFEAQTRLNKIPFEETLKLIGKIEQAIVDINNIPNIAEIDAKEGQLQAVKSNIKKTKNRFDESLKKRCDELLLQYYAELKEGIGFVSEDFRQCNFKMSFNPLNISISGQKTKDRDSNEIVSYNPGSMARETTWQVLAYMAIFQILKENFGKLPVIPVLFIDGLNQPFDDTESYSNLYQFLKNKALSLGIQLFITSTRDGSEIGIEDQIKLTGFNKSHKIL